LYSDWHLKIKLNCAINTDLSDLVNISGTGVKEDARRIVFKRLGD
jgi:hypothetical protein